MKTELTLIEIDTHMKMPDFLTLVRKIIVIIRKMIIKIQEKYPVNTVINQGILIQTVPIINLNDRPQYQNGLPKLNV